MTGEYDYNQLLSIFYISYILAEIPSGIACKWMGPGWFIRRPAAFGSFLVCLSQA